VADRYARTCLVENSARRSHICRETRLGLLDDPDLLADRDARQPGPIDASKLGDVAQGIRKREFIYRKILTLYGYSQPTKKASRFSRGRNVR
jgi:hypothetical protein